MEKGFTLIELLAVIVILAIIALIATPIILGIINDAREESNERSVELYASAVRNAIAAYQLKGTNAPTKFSDLTVEYEGNVECDVEELYEDGSFYLAGCEVNGSEKTYSYGTQQNETPDTEEIPDSGSTQVYKPQYYYFGLDWSGTVGTTAAPTNPSTEPPTGEIRYLGYDVTDGVVSTAYVCFVRNETEYCLKGYDVNAYDTNNDVLEEAFGASACSLVDNYYDCSTYGLSAVAISDGFVNVDDGIAYCRVYGNNSRFECYEW